MTFSDFWRVVLFVSVGGGLGGMLFWTSAYLSSLRPTPIDGSVDGWFATPWFCVANLFTGVGGAWAALLAMLWAKRAPTGGGLEDALMLLSLSILAGYAGTRLLPAAAERLTGELIKGFADQARESARSAQLNAASARLSKLASEVFAYLAAPRSEQSKRETGDYALKLEDALRAEPTSRTEAILLGRIKAELQGDNRGAIKALTEFIDAKRRATSKDDADVADALWNLASYSEFEYKKSLEARSPDPYLRKAAIQALEECIEIVPEYRTSLKEDQDFGLLLSDDAARALRVNQ